MKYLIGLFCLVSVCKAQSSMTCLVYHPYGSSCDCSLIIKSEEQLINYFEQFTDEQPTYDTIQTIIAVADTAMNENIYWVKVYEVNEINIKYGSPPANEDGIVFAMAVPLKLKTHIKYLDADKKELPNNLIIFKPIE